MYLLVIKPVVVCHFMPQGMPDIFIERSFIGAFGHEWELKERDHIWHRCLPSLAAGQWDAFVQPQECLVAMEL